MMTTQPDQRIIEVAVEGRQRKCRMRGAAIVALLLLGPATAALAADPAAGQKIFKTQCSICHAVEAGQNRIGPTLFDVVGRRSGNVAGFNYTADHKKLACIIQPGAPRFEKMRVERCIAVLLLSAGHASASPVVDQRWDLHLFVG